MHAQNVYTLLHKRDTAFLSVPDSLLKGLLGLLEEAGEVVHCSSEEEILGMGAGLALCGKVPVALIQNSGLARVLNVHLSLNKLYGLPMLLIVGWRGKGKDSPETFHTGQRTPDILRAAGIAFRELGKEGSVSEDIDAAFKALDAGDSFALLVDKGVLE